MDLFPLREPEEHDHQAVDGEQRVAVQFSYYAPDLLDPHCEDLVDSDLRVFVQPIFRCRVNVDANQGSRGDRARYLEE